jgi:hypothetical protein
MILIASWRKPRQRRKPAKRQRRPPHEKKPVASGARASAGQKTVSAHIEHPVPAARSQSDKPYIAPPIKRRSYRASKKFRRSKADIDEIKSAIVEVLRADHPMTVRQVFYQLVVGDVIEKTEEQYQGTVIRLLTEMRMDDRIPFAWIVDESRRRRENQTYDSIADAARETARFYRRNALRECPDYVEIWSEKEALAGVIEDAAGDYDVPVIVSKGMPSITQLYGSAVEIARAAEAGKETYIYQFGDHDPSGVLIPETIERRLNQLCERFDCPAPVIERVALTEEQIDEFHLPTCPTKRDGNQHAKNFDGDSVELDALPASELRSMVREVIERHISSETLHTLRVAEESERELLDKWANEVAEA